MCRFLYMAHNQHATLIGGSPKLFSANLPWSATTENDASRSDNGALKGQRGGCRRHLLERPFNGRVTRRWLRLCRPERSLGVLLATGHRRLIDDPASATSITQIRLPPPSPTSLTPPNACPTGVCAVAEKPFAFGGFNDNPRINWPERRTALVARELVRYKLDIAALSETQFSEQGQLENVGAGYTFFWSGRPKAERRDAGVAFAIRNDIVGRLPCLPVGINDCQMSLHLPLRGDKFTTINSA
ncbi:unnamed protein product [Schistocephalus solidus]|uniref:NRDE family protein n=1 Tax=Schistocephalus solidus TaxID=70667 RepID=A0A183TGY6_SCHSO|nr:unnamed protein product [Schistocephalus solidus]